LLEADALVLLLDRCAAADLAIALADAERDVRDFPTAFLAALDLAAEVLERLDEEALDVMGLETLRLGPFHLDPQLMHAGRRHRVVGQLSALKQIQEMLLINCAIDGLEQLGLHVFLLAILDSLHEQIAQRRSLEEFTQHVVDAAPQGLPRRFELLEKSRVHLAFTGVRGNEVPEMAYLGLANSVNPPEPLLDLVGVPRQVVVDHQMSALKVHAFARGIVGDQDQHVPILHETLDDLATLL